MKKALLYFFGLCIASPSLFAHEKPLEKDSVRYKNLGEFLQAGEVEFHIRNFFMHTENKGDLLDYNTLATGAGMAYYSPAFKGFHVGFGGFFVFRLWEHNLSKPDPTTQNGNRYEVLLFDMHDVDNFSDLDRLEELYLSYENKGLQLVFGRQKFTTPLFNGQDNRMRPNLFSGISGVYRYSTWKVSKAWFTHATLRGTVDWFTIANSFGVYPFGASPQGTSSGYKGTIDTKGVLLSEVSNKWEKDKWENNFQIWNHLAENVFNITFVQNDFHYLVKNIRLGFGIQGFSQFALNHGGNPNLALTYIQPNEKAKGLGKQIAVRYQKHDWNINALWINQQGRFLFPREWGRENFYASLPRERFEGAGGVKAITVNYRYYANETLDFRLGVSDVQHKDYTNYILNKYGVPSYYHLVLESNYHFQNFFEGLNFRTLIAHKNNPNLDQITPLNRINRVGLWNFSFILDYKF